ncbi:MAG: sugar porter family MFS transporter [Bryobacteraceae bacterium]|nr:sugar porter family MFS transporter [Bryobacteraceae bacterium]
MARNRAYVYFISLVAAVGGLLFGFDIAIINGALVFLKKQFALTDVQTEIAASALLIGCVFGAGVAGAASDRYGRRRMLLISAAMFALSAFAAALPRNLAEFVIARFAGGLAIGVASVLSPLYIAEMAPADIRGRLVSINQFAIVIGILLAYFVSWQLAGLGLASWRWMFVSAALPSALFFVALLRVPESPRWLVKEGRSPEALAVLKKVNGAADADAGLEAIRSAVAEESGSLRQLLEPGLRRPLIIAVGLAILQQITGVNTILFYGSLIYTEHAGGQTASAALLANVIVGATNLVFTVVALAVIDRIGRKAILMLASGGMGLSLIVLGALFRLNPSAIDAILAVILVYVAFFAVGMGPGVWVVMSELFPTRIRGRAMAIATVTLWIACTALTLTFLSLVNAVTVAGAFWIYAGICVFTFFFVWRAVPETKGKTLEEIERSWTRREAAARQSSVR